MAIAKNDANLTGMQYAILGFLSDQHADYFVRQQKDIGAVNGYIEEMMNGQKVVKAFCYECNSKAQFDERNERLFESGDSANKYANVLMPVM